MSDNFFTKFKNFIVGSRGNLLKTVTETIDEFVHSPEERAKLKKEMLKLQNDQSENFQDFTVDMEKMQLEYEAEMEKIKSRYEVDMNKIDSNYKVQMDKMEKQAEIEKARFSRQRDEELERTIRTELDAKKSVIVAELNQGDKYTKRARPTVVYIGLVFILMELLGLRLILLNKMGVSENIIITSNDVFAYFMFAWAGVIGAYSIGRSVEKSGVRKFWSSRLTGNPVTVFTESQINEETIVRDIKEKVSR
jgi:hypothetical protein